MELLTTLIQYLAYACAGMFGAWLAGEIHGYYEERMMAKRYLASISQPCQVNSKVDNG